MHSPEDPTPPPEPAAGSICRCYSRFSKFLWVAMHSCNPKRKAVAKLKVVPLLWVIFICTVGLPGCSGKGTVTVTLSPTTTPSINQGQTQVVTAVVTNDPTNSGVNWSLGSGEVGTLINVTTTSVTYQAPPTLTVNTTATVIATSV